MFEEITKPTLIIDKAKCVNNIIKMLDKATRHNLIFRPHFKTHQSAIIGDWFKDFGVTAITVSSVEMAEYFAAHGWQDITIAFPVNIREINAINNLTKSIELNLLVTTTEHVNYLRNNLTAKVGVFIKIDTGYHRSGIDCNNIKLIKKVIELISTSSNLKFEGFLTHSGHTYQADSTDEIILIHRVASSIMGRLKNEFAKEHPELIISVGDTPSCSLANDFTGIDEIRPGNFVFYDVMQYRLGTCRLDDIAVAVACPVVDVQPERNEIIIYGGAIHLSKEFIQHENGMKNFGYLARFEKRGWQILDQDNYVSTISQEHGTVRLTNLQMREFRIGDIIGVVPVHSCLTNNLLIEKSRIK